MIKKFYLGFLLFCLLAWAPKAFACTYADEKSPFAAYIDANLIFHGRALKQGVEIVDNNGFKFTLFEVIEPIKNAGNNVQRVYHKADFDGYDIGSEGLVVSIEKKGVLALAGLCTVPFYDIKVPPGQSLFAVHKSILSRLGMVLAVVALFAGFVVYYYIKRHEDDGAPT